MLIHGFGGMQDRFDSNLQLEKGMWCTHATKFFLMAIVYSWNYYDIVCALIYLDRKRALIKEIIKKVKV
jgi:hypothetical protein